MSQGCPEGPDNPPEIANLYPPGSIPEKRLHALSALCSYGITQQVMTGALRQTLIQHFSDARNMLNSSLRARLAREGVWRDDEQTGIVIESITRWRPELSESRPALLVKHHEWTWLQMGIGNFSGENARSGEMHFGGYWNGAHTIFVLSKDGGEASILATEVAKCLLFFQSEIATQLSLQRFVVVSIGEVAALKESRETYVVPVVVAYQVSETWYLQPDAPRTKRIVFKSSIVLPDY